MSIAYFYDRGTGLLAPLGGRMCWMVPRSTGGVCLLSAALPLAFQPEFWRALGALNDTAVVFTVQWLVQQQGCSTQGSELRAPASGS